jgi:phosphoglycolate phosphatase
MSIKLIIFDLDGTLTDSLADLTAAANHMLSAFGRPIMDETGVRQLVGEGARRLVERAMPGATGKEVEQGLTIFLAYNEAHIADQTVLYPGVAKTLAALHAKGLTIALLSNKNELLCRKLLEALGVNHYFAEVVGADSLPERKPSPEPVRYLLKRFGVLPQEAAMVGDSINDIAAGDVAGVVTIGCTYGYGNGEDLATATYRIDTLPELLGLAIFAEKWVDN